MNSPLEQVTFSIPMGLVLGQSVQKRLRLALYAVIALRNPWFTTGSALAVGRRQTSLLRSLAGLRGNIQDAWGSQLEVRRCPAVS